MSGSFQPSQDARRAIRQAARTREAAALPSTCEYADRTINISAGRTATWIQRNVIDKIGKFIPYGVQITITFADGTYTMDRQLSFYNFYGGGNIAIQGNTGDTEGLSTSRSVILDGSALSAHVIGLYKSHGVQFVIQHLHVKMRTNVAAWYAGIYNYGATHQTIRWNYFEGNGTSYGYGYCGLMGFASLSENVFGNMNRAIASYDNADVTSDDNDDAGSGMQPAYGLYTATWGRIWKLNGQPSGATADEAAGGGAGLGGCCAAAGGGAPAAHAGTHELGGADQLDLSGLGGVLADEQNAGQIKGAAIDTTGLADDYILVYDSGAGQWVVDEKPAGGSTFPIDNDEFMTARNNADNADVDMWKVNAADDLELGAGLDVEVGTSCFKDGLNVAGYWQFGASGEFKTGGNIESAGEIYAATHFRMKEIAAASTPIAVATCGRIYCKDNDLLYFQDGGGVEHTVDLDGGGGGGGTDAESIRSVPVYIDSSGAEIQNGDVLVYDDSVSGGQFIPQASGGVEAENVTYTIPAGSTAAEAQAIVDSIGKRIMYGVTVTIQFEDGSYDWTAEADLHIAGFCGPGVLQVTGNESGAETAGLHTNQGCSISIGANRGFRIEYNECTVQVRYIKITATGTSNTELLSFFLNTGPSYAQFCYLVGNSATGSGNFGVSFYKCYSASVQYVYVNKVYRGTNINQCLYGGLVNNADTGTMPYVGNATYWTRIYRSGTYIDGSGADFYAANGGVFT